MNVLASYGIPIYGLDNRRYDYTFTSDDSFFAALDQQLIRRGNLTTHIVLDKSETMIRLDFHIVGTVSQVCDRSLDEYDEPVDAKQMLLLKFSDHNEELTDEIELIERNTPVVNVARYIFEYASLSLPMKKLHPRFRLDEDPDDESEGEIIYRSDPDESIGEAGQPTVDPRWEALRKLSDN